MTAQTRDDLSAVPGIAPIRDAATAGFVFNHTMLRIRDPKASLDFYTRVLGFALARKVDFEQLVLRRHVYTMHILPVPADDIWAGKQSHRQLSDILLRMTGKVLGTEWLILFLTSFDYLQNLLNGFVSERSKERRVGKEVVSTC